MGLCASVQEGGGSALVGGGSAPRTGEKNPMRSEAAPQPADAQYNYSDTQTLDCNKQTVQLKLAWDMFEGVASVDLDAQAVMFDSDGKFLEGCYFNNLSACGGAVKHSGDQRDGSADGWDEIITLDLTQAAERAQIISVCVCAYNDGSSFEHVETARVELHASDGSKLSEIQLGACGKYTSAVLALLWYDLQEFQWKIRKVGALSSGRNFRDVLPIMRHAIAETMPSMAVSMRQASDSHANKLQFFKDVASCNMNRDYIVIVDRSGSMYGTSWEQAEKAVSFLAPHIVKADPDGVSLYFFDSVYSHYGGVKSAKRVNDLFKKEKPGSSTNLSGVLKAAFKERKRGKEATILIITDGTPDNEKNVERVIIKETKRMSQDGELSLSFIQVGSAKTAAKWLSRLDDCLVQHGAKFDIVDKLTSDKLKDIGFNKMIENSILD